MKECEVRWGEVRWGEVTYLPTYHTTYLATYLFTYLPPTYNHLPTYLSIFFHHTHTFVFDHYLAYLFWYSLYSFLCQLKPHSAPFRYTVKSVSVVLYVPFGPFRSVLVRFGTFRLVSVSCDTNNKSCKRVIILLKQDKITCSNDIISRLNELLSCLNKISNLFERHIKSFKRVIMLLNQDK